MTIFLLSNKNYFHIVCLFSISSKGVNNLAYSLNRRKFMRNNYIKKNINVNYSTIFNLLLLKGRTYMVDPQVK